MATRPPPQTRVLPSRAGLWVTLRAETPGKSSEICQDPLAAFLQRNATKGFDPLRVKLRAWCRGGARCRGVPTSEVWSIPANSCHLFGLPVRGGCLYLGFSCRELGANQSPASIPLPVLAFFEYLLFWCSPRETAQLSAPGRCLPSAPGRGAESGVRHPPALSLGFCLGRGVFGLLVQRARACLLSVFGPQKAGSPLPRFPRADPPSPFGAFRYLGSLKAQNGSGFVPSGDDWRRRGTSAEGHTELQREPPLSEERLMTDSY